MEIFIVFILGFLSGILAFEIAFYFTDKRKRWKVKSPKARLSFKPKNRFFK